MADVKRSDTTRYLSAAAYRDEGFRYRVIGEVVDERYRAIGPSYGIDLANIARHCLIANRMDVMRDISLIVLLFFTVLLGLTESVFPLIPDTVLPLLAAWFVVFLRSRRTESIVVSNFTKATYVSESSNLPFAGKLNSYLESRLTDIAAGQSGNVVVYSDSRFSPFVGAGLDVPGWSFTVRIDKGKEQLGISLEPIRFRLEDLYEYVTNRIGGLGLDGLVIEDKLYVDGQEIRDDNRFLDTPFTRPYAEVERSLVKSFVDNPSQAVRYYKALRVESWKGELILSIFLRFAQVKSNLYAEANYFLLPPIHAKYHKVDAIIPTPTLSRVIRQIAKVSIQTPLYLLFSPLLTLRHVLRGNARWQQRRHMERLIDRNAVFDYGARISIRESETSSEYRRYFQRLDKEMNFKLIEQQILDSITEFLDSKNIDTSDLQNRQQTILNQGVILTGGSIEAKNLSVGQGAKSQISRVTGRVGQQPQQSSKAGIH